MQYRGLNRGFNFFFGGVLRILLPVVAIFKAQGRVHPLETLLPQRLLAAISTQLTGYAFLHSDATV